MKARSKPTEKRERSVFSTIFISVLVILAVEVTLLIGSIAVSRVPQQLDRNAEDILAKQVENRSRYLEDFLVQAQNLGDMPNRINEKTEALLTSGQISKDTLGQSSASSEPLLEAIADDLVTQLRSSSVTGVFVVLNTCDLDARKTNGRLPGIYLRDLDPDAAASERNEDLMLSFAPAGIVKSMRISTDSCWQPALDYEELDDFVYQPFMTAYQDGGKLLMAQYGRWTTSPYVLPGDKREAIAYAQPLILPDGTVYGVVGVELLCSYLEEQLPLTELQNDGTGAYLLAVTTDEKPVGSIPLQPVTFSTQDRSLKSAQSIVMQDSSAAGTIVVNKTKYFACAEPLTLYDCNAPFSNEHWLLLGIVPNSTLYKISNDMQSLLLVAVVLTLGVGLVCSYLVSRGLAHPIRQLSDEVAAIQDKRTAIPKLSRTGIREIDGFSTAITQLSQDILDTSTKFLRIMDMASIELGGYEIREDSDKVFVTDNFFSMLGMQNANPNDVTRERFEMLMEELVLQKESFSLQDGGRVFTIPQKDGSERFVMLRITGEDEVQVGLVEDVTAATLERRRIEHERDYDVLTGLYNRRAFDARAKKLFRMPEKLGHAALLMMDMDNLKHINDTFGHDWGDRYINLAGQCFAQTLPQNTICARMSGDEFIVLFYGYDRRDEIRQVLNRLSKAIKERTALLPNGDTMRISISGGIAWYPENGRDLATLKKYADFAMYQVKHEAKGEMGEFDIGAYNQEVYAAQLRREFLQMLRENSADYHFQPIFSAHTGRVAAYEALMRVKMQLLNSPLTVMKLARELDKLYEVERLTAFKATSTFVMMQNRGQLHRNTKLFLNSIASSSLTDEDVAKFKAQFAELLNNLVIEITEEEEIDREALERKRRAMGDQGALALDDWGSGYSNSNSLLELSPDYIKVDITIICDIDTDADKQQLVKDIVEYAHGRGMKIVAEGIETEAELRKVIELGVDLLQGYFLAKPAASPSEIAPQALSVIRWMNR